MTDIDCMSCIHKCKASCCHVIHIGVGYLTADQVNYYELRGIKVERVARNKFGLVIPAKCSALDEDFRCTLHGTLDKPYHCGRMNMENATDYYITDGCLAKGD